MNEAPPRVGDVLLLHLCAFLWPLLAGAGALAMLALVVFAVTGGHYGQLTLFVGGPIVLGLWLTAALLRAGAKRLERAGRSPQ